MLWEPPIRCVLSNRTSQKSAQRESINAGHVSNLVAPTPAAHESFPPDRLKARGFLSVGCLSASVLQAPLSSGVEVFCMLALRALSGDDLELMVLSPLYEVIPAQEGDHTCQARTER